MSVQLILASSSPRRAELLRQIRIPFRVLSAEVDETPVPDELPDDYVRRLALAKAQAVLADVGRAFLVLGADTVVVLDRRLLTKPVDIDDNARMLRALSGRVHQVHTAVCVASSDDQLTEVVRSDVEFVTVDARTAHAYAATGEGADKAGGYGIQGLGGIFVKRLVGSYSAVVGLPLAETEGLLGRLGLDTWRSRIDEI